MCSAVNGKYYLHILIHETPDWILLVAGSHLIGCCALAACAENGQSGGRIPVGIHKITVSGISLQSREAAQPPATVLYPPITKICLQS